MIVENLKVSRIDKIQDKIAFWRSYKPIFTAKKSKFAVNKSLIHVSDDMSGKMFGFPSISTSSFLCDFCKDRQKVIGSVCHNCFAMDTQSVYRSVAKALVNNYHLLKSRILDLSQLPIFKSSVKQVRIESFGDVDNENQAINYINIAKVNPNIIFSFWTKSHNIWKKALEKAGKPTNLIYIQSSFFLNKEEKKANNFVDKIFTVYTLDYLFSEFKNDIKKIEDFINCGSRDCLSCQACYKHNRKIRIRELLKSDQKRLENIKEKLNKDWIEFIKD